MKTISKVLLGLLLIAPGLRASQAAPAKASQPKTDAELKEQAAVKKDHKLKDDLSRALYHDDMPLVQAMLTHIDDIQRLYSSEKIHPLYATENPEMIKLLLTHKADLNYKALFDEDTPLIHFCYRFKHYPSESTIPCIRVLLDQPKIDVNAHNKEKETALAMLITPFECTEDNYMKVITMLFAHGANPCIKGKDGKTIFDLIADPRSFMNMLPYKTLAAIIVQRKIDLNTALQPHLFKSPAGIVVEYTGEDSAVINEGNFAEKLACARSWY